VEQRIIKRKRCGKCNRVKPAASFHRCRKAATGLQSACKQCKLEIQRQPASVEKQKSRRTGEGPHRFAHARAVSRQRGRVWTLDSDQFYELIRKPCEYCGFPVSKCGTGLDRKDSSSGYTPDNVVPCCSDCNTAKSDAFTFEEMKVIGAAIREVKLRRAVNG